MQEISLLSKKCLANMPMLLDVLAMTINNVKEILSPAYNNTKAFLINELTVTGNSCYQFDEKFAMQGLISCLEQESDNIIYPKLTLTYKLPFTYCYRKKEYAFDIGWEYLSNEECNKIQFYLSDVSNACTLMNNVMVRSLLEQIPNSWQKGEDENGIYMELTIDASFTEEKFLQCLTDYKEYVLKPFITSLGSKYTHQ